MHLNVKKSEEKCGYCKGKKPEPGGCTWGIGSPRLSVKDY
jgi:hypothetical protein